MYSSSESAFQPALEKMFGLTEIRLVRNIWDETAVFVKYHAIYLLLTLKTKDFKTETITKPSKEC